jgi:hypothetical protein
MIVVVIKANFAPGEEFRMLRQVRKLFLHSTPEWPARPRVRVNTGSRTESSHVTLCKWQRRRQRVGASADGQNVPHPGRLRSRQHVPPRSVSKFRHVHGACESTRSSCAADEEPFFPWRLVADPYQPGADRHILENRRARDSLRAPPRRPQSCRLIPHRAVCADRSASHPHLAPTNCSGW